MSNRLRREGPLLQELLHRLAETPAEFLAEPRIGRHGQVQVAAVAGDLLVMLGAPASPEDLARFGGRERTERNALAVTLILSWLLADRWFLGARLTAPDLLALLGDGAHELAATPARRFIDDPDRREELVRVALAALGCRPAGETEAHAADRLTSLSSAERARVVAASREAERRARAIREALKKKAAEESADKWTRE